MRVVHVRHVWVPMTQSLVPVPMGMRFTWRIVRPVLMLMVLVVNVPMRVLQWLVLMLVVMVLGEMEPDAEPHQQPRQDKLDGDWLMQQ